MDSEDSISNTPSSSQEDTFSSLLEDARNMLQVHTEVVAELRRLRDGAADNAILGIILSDMERRLLIYGMKFAEAGQRFQELETTKYDGKMIWKIRDFRRRREDAKHRGTLSISSQPFYTSRYGYKMCLRIYLNGYGMGKNTHISLFFVLMKGEYDALLPFPFNQKVSLSLLDQGPQHRNLMDTFRPDPTSSSFKRPVSDMNIASGCPMFVTHGTIDNSAYVVDDTIFIKVIVDTTDLDNL